MRQVKEFDTADGKRYRVRYRLGGTETSETFPRKADAEMFRDILGDGRGDRVTQAMRWLKARQDEESGATKTFGQWFAYYVDQLTGVTPRTRNDYWSLHRRYLAHLDPMPLTLLTRQHVTTLVNDLDRAGRAPKTIKQTIHMLSTCLTLAIDEGHLTANPCRNVRLPTVQIGGIEPRFMTYEEARALIVATPVHYQPLVTFLLGTGMRWSEATALSVRHVNFTAGTIRVEQAWKRVPGQGFVIGPPKTKKAKRTVNPAVMALVAAKTLTTGKKQSDLVFTALNGGPVRHANFYNNVWRPAVQRAGLDPAPRIHDCRHSFASWLISDGISLEAVQDQLGHESIETTRKVYAHLLPAVGIAVGVAASAAMEAVLQGVELGQSTPLGLPPAAPG